jgi:hypothetical protein
MFLKYLSGIWTALAPAMGNHLWHSTLFAITAGLLTLALRKNRARARYWLWLAASVKFLVPFSLLVVVGSRLPAPAIKVARAATKKEPLFDASVLKYPEKHTGAKDSESADVET